nr:MAG TPA: Defence against restriction A C-terminal [Siphoviridae sp. ctjRi1]
MGRVVSAWGWALYDRRLSMEEIQSYELAYGGEVER